jgi:hypothetical protein
MGSLSVVKTGYSFTGLLLLDGKPGNLPLCKQQQYAQVLI